MPKREEVNFSFAGHTPHRTRGLRVLNHEELHAGKVSLADISRVVNTSAQQAIAGLFARAF